LSIYFSWAEYGIWVYFILEISIVWGPSVSRAVAVFALLLAERGGVARHRWRGNKAIVPTGCPTPTITLPHTPAPTAQVRCLAHLAAVSECRTSVEHATVTVRTRRRCPKPLSPPVRSPSRLPPRRRAAMSTATFLPAAAPFTDLFSCTGRPNRARRASSVKLI
jgi:hypothetical protein